MSRIYQLHTTHGVLKRPGVAIVAAIIKIQIKKRQNYLLKWNFYLILRYDKNCLFCVKIADVSRTQPRSLSRQIEIYILCIFFRWGMHVPSLIIMGYVWEILMRGRVFKWAAPECPILKKTKRIWQNYKKAFYVDQAISKNRQ